MDFETDLVNKASFVLQAFRCRGFDYRAWTESTLRETVPLFLSRLGSDAMMFMSPQGGLYSQIANVNEAWWAYHCDGVRKLVGFVGSSAVLMSRGGMKQNEMLL